MSAAPTRARFVDACAQIGTELGDFGFRYLRSERQAKKVIGTQVVSFKEHRRGMWIGRWPASM